MIRRLFGIGAAALTALALGASGPAPARPPAEAPAPATGSAKLTVRVPEGAKVWLDDYESTKAGTERQFVTPNLAAGQTYHYTVKAVWTAPDGRPVTRIREVNFTAGTDVVV